MRRKLVCGLVLLLATSGRAHAAGVIHGTIWPTRADARRAAAAHASTPPEERQGLFDFLGSPGMDRRPKPEVKPASAKPVASAPEPKPQGGIVDAVVAVREIPDKIEQKLAQQSKRDRTRPLPRMTIHHSRYEPRVMAVTAGTELEFQNLDRIWHNAFSVSSASRFDLGKIKPGAIDTVKLERDGVINLHCDIHPDEIGFVVITPNHASARPDASGRFTLPKLPPGEYQVEIWHPLRGNRVVAVTVPKRGDVTCDLAF